jgi:beta-lactamase class A
MRDALTRRLLLLGAGSLLATSARSADTPVPSLAALEVQIGGRIGVAAIDARTGARLLHRADERFAMCSTFKWLLAAAILTKADQGLIALDQPVPLAAETTANVDKGALPVEALCKAAVEASDNTAANLLLPLIGGPPGLTAFLHKTGDRITRLDRNEPTLNTNLPGDPRDTTTPSAMAATMNRILVGDVLTPARRDMVLTWMKNSTTGLKRIRAGLPPDWICGDKTGTGENGATNDVAIIWPPNRLPILVAAYLSESQSSPAALDAVHAKITGIVTTVLV